MKPSLLHSSRFGWFVVVGALFGARDMCAGNGGPPPQDPPADAPSDAPDDGSMTESPAPAPPKTGLA